MKRAECGYCSEVVEFVPTSDTRGIVTGRWRHEGGKAGCSQEVCGEGWKSYFTATPKPGTVVKTVEDVHVTYPGLG